MRGEFELLLAKFIFTCLSKQNANAFCLFGFFFHFELYHCQWLDFIVICFILWRVIDTMEEIQMSKYSYLAFKIFGVIST